MKDISDKEKRDILKVVLDSKTFSKSPTSANLLRLLVESTIEKREIKETTVGMELFGSQFLDQNNSSRIRVNIYNLRKKLDSYYKNDGVKDPLRIVIDKGQYYVSFVSSKKTLSQNTFDKKKYQFALLGSIGIALLFGILFFLMSYKSSIPFWKPFFNNGKETNVVVGDFFGFLALTKTGRIGWNRDYDINSLDEFYAYQKEHPDFNHRVYPANYSYITSMGPIAVHNLTRLFASRNKDFSIRISSKSSYSDIKENNSVYVGPTKNKNKFVQYFNEHNEYFTIKDRKLYYKNSKKDRDTVLNMDIEGTAYEYAIVSRLKGEKETEQFLFFSDHDMGVVAATELFCNPAKIKTFQKEYLEDYETFTAVFLVKGKERTNFDLELLLLDATN